MYRKFCARKCSDTPVCAALKLGKYKSGEMHSCSISADANKGSRTNVSSATERGGAFGLIQNMLVQCNALDIQDSLQKSCCITTVPQCR